MTADNVVETRPILTVLESGDSLDIISFRHLLPKAKKVGLPILTVLDQQELPFEDARAILIYHEWSIDAGDLDRRLVARYGSEARQLFAPFDNKFTMRNLWDKFVPGGELAYEYARFRADLASHRSEERRVGKEGRSRW